MANGFGNLRAGVELLYGLSYGGAAPAPKHDLSLGGPHMQGECGQGGTQVQMEALMGQGGALTAWRVRGSLGLPSSRF